MKIFFLALIIFSAHAEEFSWSEFTPEGRGYSPGEQPVLYTRERGNRNKELKRRILFAVDPRTFQFRDHRRKRELNILVFGDSGTGKKDQIIVAKKMFAECQKLSCDFALVLGDIIYEDGLINSDGKVISKTDMWQLNKKFELPYQDFKYFDFWLVPGNHDWRGDIQLSINYTQKSVRWKMPYTHYEVPRLPKWIKIYGLDTTRIEQLEPTSANMMEQITHGKIKYKAKAGLVDEPYKTDFCRSKGWKVLFGHHGIYTSGRHGRLDAGNYLSYINPFRKKGWNRNMKRKLLPFIKKCGVQLYLVGHDHHQEYIKAIDPRTKKVIYHQILQGTAGKVRESFEVKHPEYKSLSKRDWFGFSILTFTPYKVHVRYYGYPPGHPARYSMYFENIYITKKTLNELFRPHLEYVRCP